MILHEIIVWNWKKYYLEYCIKIKELTPYFSLSFGVVPFFGLKQSQYSWLKTA